MEAERLRADRRAIGEQYMENMYDIYICRALCFMLGGKAMDMIEVIGMENWLVVI